MTFAPATHVFRRNWLVYRRIWHRSIVFGFLQPFMFLTAMGIGMGALLAQNPNAFGGMTYLEFLGPGLLAASSMQLGTFESTYPIMNKIMWGRNYEAMLATPLNTRNILLGELGWIGFRMATLAAVFMIVLAGFGIVASPIAILAIPVAVLVGLGFSAALMGYTATQKNDLGFTWIFRFVINPLFLFSGTFFPLSQLPQLGRDRRLGDAALPRRGADPRADAEPPRPGGGAAAPRLPGRLRRPRGLVGRPQPWAPAGDLRRP